MLTTIARLARPRLDLLLAPSPSIAISALEFLDDIEMVFVAMEHYPRNESPLDVMHVAAALDPPVPCTFLLEGEEGSAAREAMTRGLGAADTTVDLDSLLSWLARSGTRLVH